MGHPGGKVKLASLQLGRSEATEGLPSGLKNLNRNRGRDRSSIRSLKMSLEICRNSLIHSAVCRRLSLRAVAGARATSRPRARLTLLARAPTMHGGEITFEGLADRLQSWATLHLRFRDRPATKMGRHGLDRSRGAQGLNRRKAGRCFIPHSKIQLGTRRVHSIKASGTLESDVVTGVRKCWQLLAESTLQIPV